MIALDERPDTKQLPEWLPCVFGNGEDDDTPGLISVFANEKVQIIDEIAMPNEDVVIDGMELVITRRITLITECGKKAILGAMWDEEGEIVIRTTAARHTTITRCNIHFRDS